MARIRAGLIGAIVAALVCCAGGASASTGVSPRIVGGTSATNPGWIAYLGISFPAGDAFCGGELIAKSWLLTAAHCVTDDGATTPVSPSAVSAWVGFNLLSDSDSLAGSPVDQVIVDPDYDPVSLDGDAALLHLTSPDSHDPVAIAGRADPPVGSMATVLGWGITDNIAQALSNSLLRVAAPILDPNRCAAIEPGYDATSKICAGATLGQDSCSGDSGGPLVSAGGTSIAALLGTVDYGSATCGDGQPSVYQRATSGAVYDFIAARVPTVSVSPDGAGAVPSGSSQQLSANANGLPSPTFAWDLDADGAYDDATGATTTIRPTTNRSIGVRATGSNGDVALRRITLPVQPGQVRVTGPTNVFEGSNAVLQVKLATAGIGQVVATGSVLGLAPLTSATWIDNAATTLPVSTPNDSVWREPRTMTVGIEAHNLTLTTPSRLRIQVTDDDKPKLTTPRVRRSGHTLVVTFHPPGGGKVAVTAARGRSVLVKRVAAVSGTSKSAVELPLDRRAWKKLRGTKPLVRIVWHTPAQWDAKATRTVRGPRLPRR